MRDFQHTALSLMADSRLLEGDVKKSGIFSPG